MMAEKRQKRTDPEDSGVKTNVTSQKKTVRADTSRKEISKAQKKVWANPSALLPGETPEHPDSGRVQKVLDTLDEIYGKDQIIYLHHANAWQLLIATILSAQCTDARVNVVTRDLFRKYQSVEDFANASQEELEQDIHSVGFYHMKAKNIIACCRRLHDVYHDEVPDDIDDLTSLAGVGRKTANVIRGNIFHEPSIVVDTHVKRISGKLAFTVHKDPKDIEFDLMKVLPREHWVRYNMQIITLGRNICFARNPHCGECPLARLCPSCTVSAADR